MTLRTDRLSGQPVAPVLEAPLPFWPRRGSPGSRTGSRRAGRAANAVHAGAAWMYTGPY